MYLGGGSVACQKATQKLAQAILDWRDEDELPRINGGEREEYLEEGALVDTARAHMAIEVTVGALRCAERPVNVEAKPRALPGFSGQGRRRALEQDPRCLPRHHGIAHCVREPHGAGRPRRVCRLAR